VDPKERAIRRLYEMRARRDWDAVGTLLADNVAWHEPANESQPGSYRGRDEVLTLLQRLVQVTGGTFQLEPTAFLNSVEHSAVLVRWSAEREGRRSEGTEIAVYGFADEKIAQVWFHVDGYERESFSAVFAFD